MNPILHRNLCAKNHYFRDFFGPKMHILETSRISNKTKSLKSRKVELKMNKVNWWESWWMRKLIDEKVNWGDSLKRHYKRTNGHCFASRLKIHHIYKHQICISFCPFVWADCLYNCSDTTNFFTFSWEKKLHFGSGNNILLVGGQSPNLLALLQS